MRIIWRDIPGLVGLYQASNHGDISSLPRKTTKGKILSKTKDKYGYDTVCLSVNGKSMNKTVHKLVGITFLPNPNNLPQINHKDENKANNFVWVNDDGTVDPEKSNLEWCTAEQNINHGTRNKRMIENRNGKTAPKRVSCTNKYNEVFYFDSMSKAAVFIGVSDSCVRDCVKGKQKQTGGYIIKKVGVF